MRVTLSIPDLIARQFQKAVPLRQRSRVVAALLEKEVRRRKEALEAACREANADRPLDREIDEWQAFEDAPSE